MLGHVPDCRSHLGERRTGLRRIPTSGALDAGSAWGTYLVRGGQVETLEGNWRPKQVVVVRFHSVEAACNWWRDPTCSELKAMRQRSTTTNMILVEGLPNA